MIIFSQGRRPIPIILSNTCLENLQIFNNLQQFGLDFQKNYPILVCPFSNRCGEKLEPPYTCACDDNCQFFGDCCQDFRWFDGFIRFIRLFHYYTQFTGRPVVKSSFSRSCKTSTACSSALVGHNLIINSTTITTCW